MPPISSARARAARSPTTFIDKLTDYRESIARLPGQMGRPRPELGRDVRSTTYGNYVIFLRYADEDAPRSHLYVTRIVHGARHGRLFPSTQG
jgi:toxin ParE1/3/4